MCVLIVCRVPDSRFPLLVGANREEDPARPTAPPGLRTVDGRRALFPRDRRHGGSFLGVNDAGVLVALTNWAHVPVEQEARSRGGAVLAALAGANARDAIAKVDLHAADAPIRPFQLVAADARETWYCRHAADCSERMHLQERLVVITNRHAPREVEIPGLASWADALPRQPGDVESWLDHLVVTLATAYAIEMSTGESFAVCRGDGCPRTVSGTVIGLPAGDVGQLRLRYAAGNPREAPFRDYSSLSNRLAPEQPRA